jgi:hypothetical protein
MLFHNIPRISSPFLITFFINKTIGMINWQDPDYVSAGHFYSLISSVTVQCSDPVTPASNVTSYVYGSNVTTDEPGISFSTKTTINAAPSLTHAAASSVGTIFLVIAVVTGALLA